MRPRIRSLKPELWQDEKVGALSRDARVLLLGMVTLADDEGRFRARRSILHGHIFPDDDDALELIDSWVAEIGTQGIVVFYLVDRTPYGAFRNWARHQKINRPSPSDLPPPPNRKIVRENGLAEGGKGWRQAHGGLSERSLNDQGELSDVSVSPHSPTRGRAFRSDPIQIQLLCKRLAKRIVDNDPQARPAPESKRWVTDMRLLVEERGGDIAKVERIIDWSQTDPFWRSNILSPAKLRKQFTQLLLKADSKVVPIHDEKRDRQARRLAALHRLTNDGGAA